MKGSVIVQELGDVNLREKPNFRYANESYIADVADNLKSNHLVLHILVIQWIPIIRISG